MSLILDALRKADADRSRGAVPDLHAQPVLPQPPQAPARAPGWRWAAGGVAAGLAIAVALLLFARNGSAPGASDVPAASAVVAPAADGQRAAAAPAPDASTPRADSAPAAPRADPAPWPQPAARSSDRAAAPTPAPADAAPAAPVLERLPEALRAQLPPLELGGSIYSANPASRSLIVNGRLHRESEFVAPGLKLEQIKPKGAVFDFNGHRFELPL